MERKGSWVDVTKGMTKKKKAAYCQELEAMERGAEDSELGPENKEAFNFNNSMSCQTFGQGRAEGDDVTEYTQVDPGTLGETRYQASDGDSLESRESDIWAANEDSDGGNEFRMEGMDILGQGSEAATGDTNGDVEEGSSAPTQSGGGNKWGGF